MKKKRSLNENIITVGGRADGRLLCFFSGSQEGIWKMSWGRDGFVRWLMKIESLENLI